MTENKNTFVEFFIKTLIFFVFTTLFLAFFVPEIDLSEKFRFFKKEISKPFKDERTQLHLLSFIQNPAVLYKTSVMDEEEGKLKEAVRDMELAIGLLEMHGASSSVLARYNERLLKLKNKITGK
jgi:hypothetical protein